MNLGIQFHSLKLIATAGYRGNFQYCLYLNLKKIDDLQSVL